MAAESECPEVKLAWLIFDRTKRLISLQSPSPEGLPAQAVRLDDYLISHNGWGTCQITDLVHRRDWEQGKVFGAYIDAPGVLAYDMPDPAYCRDVLVPILDKELVLDDLADVAAGPEGSPST